MRTLALAAALSLALAFAFAAEARTAEGEAQLAPRGVHEANVVAEVPTRLGWLWYAEPAGAEIRFDVHTHAVDGDVVTLRSAEGEESSGGVDVGPGAYSYAWTSTRDTPVQLTYTLTGEFRFVDEPAGTGRDAGEPVKTGNGVPGLGVLAAVLALALVGKGRRPG